MGVETQATGAKGRGSRLGYTKPQVVTLGDIPACHLKPGMPHQGSETETKEQKGEENKGESQDNAVKRAQAWS